MINMCAYYMELSDYYKVVTSKSEFYIIPQASNYV